MLNQVRKAGLKMNSLVNMLEPSHAETNVVLDTGPPGVMEGERTRRVEEGEPWEDLLGPLILRFKGLRHRHLYGLEAHVALVAHLSQRESTAVDQLLQNERHFELTEGQGTMILPLPTTKFTQSAPDELSKVLTW